MRRLALLLLGGAALLAGCGSGTSPSLVPGGDAKRGAPLIAHYGCGSCHDIPGIEGAGAHVGPPLERFKQHRFIAGEIPNTPANAIRWVMHPKRIEPGTIMPDLGVTEPEARDIVAYLYAH
jgi:cytochrome c